jgi:tetratricopeptide (TPR) repeat protein
MRSHAALHNAGVAATGAGRWSIAEEFFGLAILKQPDAAESWVARGITRESLGKRELAIQDFKYASQLFTENGANEAAAKLTIAAKSRENKADKTPNENGAGFAILDGLLSTSQALIHMATKLLLPALGI